MTATHLQRYTNIQRGEVLDEFWGGKLASTFRTPWAIKTCRKCFHASMPKEDISALNVIQE